MIPPMSRSFGPNFSPSFAPIQQANRLQKNVTTVKMIAATTIGSPASARLKPTAQASMLVANAVSKRGTNLRMSLVSIASSLRESRINLMPMTSRMKKAIQGPKRSTMRSTSSPPSQPIAGMMPCARPNASAGMAAWRHLNGLNLEP